MEVFKHMVTSYFLSFEQMRLKEECGNDLTQSSKLALREYSLVCFSFSLYCRKTSIWLLFF